MRKIRINALAKAALITYPPKRFGKSERETAIKTRLLRSVWEIQDDVEVEIVMEREN